MKQPFSLQLAVYRSTFGFVIGVALAAAAATFILFFPHNGVEALVYNRMIPMVADAWLALLVTSFLVTLASWRMLVPYRWLLIGLGIIIFWMGELTGPLVTVRDSLTIILIATMVYAITTQLRRPHWLPEVLFGPWPLVIIFAVITSLRSIIRHQVLQSHAFDLGIFTQTIYKYAHLDGLFITIRGLNSLGDHFAPILMLISPLWWLWQDARILLIIQAIVVALGAYPAYQLAYQRFGSRLFGWAIALAFLTAPGIQALVSFDFHEIAFAATGLLFLAYFGFNKRWIAYWITFVLCLMIKENLPIYLAAWSIYFWIRSKNWRISLASVVLAAIWFVITMKFIIPYFSHIPAGSYQYYDFPELGATPGEAVETLVFSPIYSTNIFFHPVVKQETLAIMTAGFGWVWLLAPWAWVAAFPMLFEQFFYAIPAHWGLIFHYAAAITAPIVLGTIDGVGWLSTQTKRFHFLWQGRQENFLRWFSIFLITSALCLSITNRLFLTDLLRPSFYRMTPERQAITATLKLIQQIPPNASVAASHSLVPHLAGRNDIIAWPPVRPEPSLSDLHADWLVFNTAGSTWPKSPQEQRDLIESFITDPRYGMTATGGGAALFRKDQPDNPDIVREWRDESRQF